MNAPTAVDSQGAAVLREGSPPPRSPESGKEDVTSKEGFCPISVARDCQACAGFAPGLMTQIKMACLSYTSSPITYDHAGGARIEVRDLVRVKETVLRKAEVIGVKLNEFLVANQSRYGLMIDETPNAWLARKHNVRAAGARRDGGGDIRVVTRTKGQDVNGVIET